MTDLTELQPIRSVTKEEESGRIYDEQGRPKEIQTRIAEEPRPSEQVPKMHKILGDADKDIVDIDMVDNNGNLLSNENINAQIKRFEKKLGYDENIDEKFVQNIYTAINEQKAKGKTNIPPEALARFLTLIQRAQLAVTIFSNPNIINTLKALYAASHGGQQPPPDFAVNPRLIFKIDEGSGYDEYLNGKDDENGRHTDGLKDVLEKIANDMQAVKDPSNPQGKISLDKIESYTKDLTSIVKPGGQGTDTSLETLRSVASLAQEFVIEKIYGPNQNPTSIVEIIGIIMLTEEKYRTGKRKELIDKDGGIRLHNFLKWWYEKMYYFSDFQDDDEFSPYSYIAFYSQFRQVSAAELIITEPKKFFSSIENTPFVERRRNPYTGEYEDRRLTGRRVSKELDTFRNMLVSILTGESTNHNNSIKWETIRGLKGQEFLQGMNGVLGNQKLGFNNRWTRLYGQIATKDEDELWEFLRSDRGQTNMGGMLGKARAKATMLQYHLDQLGENKFVLTNGQLNKGNSFLRALGWKENLRQSDPENMGARKFFQSIILQALSDFDQLNSLRIAASGDKKEYKDLIEAYDAVLKALKDQRCFKNDKFPDDESEFTESFAKDNILAILKNDKYQGEGFYKDRSYLEILLRVRSLNAEQKVFNPDQIDADLKKIKKLVDESDTKENSETILRDEINLALALANKFKGWKQSDLNYFKDTRRQHRDIKGFTLKALRDAVQATYNLPQEDAIYICHFVMLQSGWTGVESKNDPTIDSANFWTTIMQFFGYRKEKEKGVFTGDPEFYNGLKRGLTVLDGMRVRVDPNWTEHQGQFIPDEKSGKTMSFLEYIQGGKGNDFSNIGGFNKSNGLLNQYAMKQFFDWHLTNLVTLREMFYDPRKNLDLTDVMKREQGFNKLVVDPEKFKRMSDYRNALRNFFSKNDFEYGLTTDKNTGDFEWEEKEVTLSNGEKKKIKHRKNKGTVMIVRERDPDDTSYTQDDAEVKDRKKNVGDFKPIEKRRYIWKEVSVEEAVWHDDILNMVAETNQSEASGESVQEKIVRSTVGWTTAICFLKHRYPILSFGDMGKWIAKAIKGERQNAFSLWDAYTPDEFEYAQEFFRNFNFESEEEDEHYTSWLGRKLLGKPDKKLRLYRTKRGYFSGKEFKAIRKRAHVLRLSLAKEEIGGGLIAAILLFLLNVLRESVGAAAKGK